MEDSLLRGNERAPSSVPFCLQQSHSSSPSHSPVLLPVWDGHVDEVSVLRRQVIEEGREKTARHMEEGSDNGRQATDDNGRQASSSQAPGAPTPVDRRRAPTPVEVSARHAVTLAYTIAY